MIEHEFDTLIIGSGAAAYNAAHWLKPHGQFALLTEGRNKGTSRNTGSDKQTYYKLSIGGQDSDSVHSMAETLFSGGGVDGDIALCEAAGSLPSFLKLANLGIPFPTNPYGEFVGYKTDHDPFRRATSAGPLTSKYMVETLEKELHDIPYFDGYLACKILTQNEKVTGVLCYQLQEKQFHLFHTNHIIWCTGGPACAYYYSVFPPSQTGMTGALLEAGAIGKNLGEWQYGLASVDFRWNVSGSYQQVIPRYYSVDDQGVEYDFLDDVPNALDYVFLKGYQWPFDVRKSQESSLIDCLVHQEFTLGRKVFMDFRTNPNGLDFQSLSKETYTYLENSKILLGTPIQRLESMNPLAIQIYKQHNIDLYNEPLEVMVSAQHHNGGIDVDTHWQTNISGLYACGEVASTLGVYRPGGSALNATQVGSMRAVSHILETRSLQAISEKTKSTNNKLCEKYQNTLANLPVSDTSLSTFYQNRQHTMSKIASHIRNKEKMEEYLQESQDLLSHFWVNTPLKDGELPLFIKTYDLLLTQCALLNAMILTANTFGSRGSALVEGDTDSPLETDNLKVLTTFRSNTFSSETQAVRPIPIVDDWFENVWADYRKRKKIT